jgi:MFS family permease
VQSLAPPDAPLRRGWIVVATAFTTLAVVYGVWYSYSVFLVALLTEFGWSRSLIAGAFSVFVLVHGALGPLTGWLAHRLGPRRLILAGGAVTAVGLLVMAETTTWWQLYLTFGGIVALGMSFAGWVPAVALIRQWFPARFGTAMGIASAGIGVGIFALVPVAQLFIDWYGWRGAYRLLALLTAGWILPAAFFLIRSPSASPEAPSTPGGARRAAAPHWTLATALGSWRFWGVAAFYFTGNAVTQMLLIHQVAYLVDHGVSAIAAASVGGAVGLVSIGAKVGWGFFSDRFGREWAGTLAFGCVVGSLGALVLAGRHPDSLLPYLYAALIGIGYGVLSPVFPAVTSDLFGGPGFSTIYGALYTVICAGLALGAWAAGRIFDATGSYAGALWSGLLLALVTPALLWLVAPRRPNPVPFGGRGEG